MLQDIRYGLRMLFKRPAFTFVAALTLALGIGANTALFTLIDAVLLQPLSFQEPDQLIRLRGTDERDGRTSRPVSIPDFVDWRAQNQSFEALAAFDRWEPSMTGAGTPSRLSAVRISPDFFSILRVQPLLGRDFLPEEEIEGRHTAVILQHAFWRNNFGGDPGIIGRTVALNRTPYTIVGVMPPDFNAADIAGTDGPAPEIWVPLALRANAGRSARSTDGVIGRLKPGVSLAQAQAEMSTIADRLSQQYVRTNAGAGIYLIPLFDQIVGDARGPLLILFIAVGFVLMIACANVANLVLARATTRSREIALRTALGAGRKRIVRQLLTESLLLSLLGGVAGLVLAIWTTDTLVAMSDGAIPRLQNLSLNGYILGFTALVVVVTGLLFGIVPALQWSRIDTNHVLKDGSRGTTSQGGGRLRSMLATGEIALSLVLLIGAGLLIKSFMQLSSVDAGFDTDRLLTANIYIPMSAYPEDQQQIAFYERVLERVGTQPGVQSAGLVSVIPLSSNYDRTGIHVEGRPAPEPGASLSADRYVVSNDYFATMGIPLVKARLFSDRDNMDAPLAVVINETMANRLFPDEDPIGRRIRLGPPTAPYRSIVGVVGDVRQYGLDTDHTMQIYLPHQQYAWPWMSLVVRTESDPAAMLGTIRNQVLSVDPEQPVFGAATMDQIMARSTAERRFSLTLLGVFAALALILASIGIYGVMAYMVSQRTYEIGIRMAIGAQMRDVIAMIIGSGLKMVLTGVGIGLVGALLVTRVLSNLLYGISSTDPATFAVITVLLTGVGLLACYIPARRAAGVDPMIAMRSE